MTVDRRLAVADRLTFAPAQREAALGVDQRTPAHAVPRHHGAHVRIQAHERRVILGVEVIGHAVDVASTATVQVELEPVGGADEARCQQLSMRIVTRDDGAGAAGEFNHDGGRACEERTGLSPVGDEVREIWLVPEFISVDTPLVPAGHDIDIPIPARQVGGLGGAALAVGAWFVRTGGSPSWRRTEHQRHLRVMRPRRVDERVEQSEIELARLRFDVGPPGMGVPEPDGPHEIVGPGRGRVAIRGVLEAVEMRAEIISRNDTRRNRRWNVE